MLPQESRRGSEFSDFERGQEVYVVGRGFIEPLIVEGEPYPSVDKVLPTFQGSRCSEWLFKLSRSLTHVNVLDLGCGNGQAMLDIEKIYENTSVHGLTKAQIEPFQHDRKKRKIGLIENLPLLYEADSMDVVYSVQALPYSEKHILKTMEDIYGVLRLGGMAFLQVNAPGDWKGAVQNMEELRLILEQSGCLAEFTPPFIGKGVYPNPTYVDIPAVAFSKQSKGFLPRLDEYIPKKFK